MYPFISKRDCKYKNTFLIHTIFFIFEKIFIKTLIHGT